MPRALRALLVCLAIATGCAGCAGARAQAEPTDPDLAAETEVVLQEAERAFPRVEQEYEGALRLRNAVEPLRDALRERLKQAEPRRLELQQQAAGLGPKPAGAEAPAIAEQRARVAALQAAFDVEYRRLLLASQRSEQMWNRLTEIRRALFSTRLTMHVASVLDPLFWQDVLAFQLPKFGVRVEMLRRRWTDYVRENDNAGTGAALAGCTAFLVFLFFWLHREIAERGRALEARAQPVAEVAALRHGAIVFLMRTLPLPAAAMLFTFVARRLDVAPPEVEDFLTAVAVALLVLGATRGAMGALLSPHAPRWRLVRAHDRTATAVYFIVVGAVDIYTYGIVAVGFQRLVNQRPETEIATIMVLTLAMIAVVAIGFRRMGAAGGERTGFVELNLAWVRPLVSLVCVACGLCLAFGYVALAGFLSGRATMSCVAVAVAILIVTTLNHLFDRRHLSQTRFGAGLARSLGLSDRAVDLGAVAVSGIARFAVIVTAGLIVFAPWGLEYGDVNPFGDFAAFVTTTDLRTWLGTFGFALLAFVVGISGTRLVVGWLDGALLPRTSLDESVRHSIRTVLGYAGFVATALATLYLMGINAQNVAVVAGALSVGIGFGLQSIVSNFVSGLIVLAERPVRVGDVVVVKGEEGRVQRISVRSTLIGTFEQSSLVVPNSDLITSIVRNRTLADPTQQMRSTLVLAPEADAMRAHEIIMALAARHKWVLDTPAPRVLFMRITELGQELEVRCNVDRFENMLQVRSDLHHAIARAFRQEGLRFANVAPETGALAAAASRAAPPRLAIPG